MSTLLSWETPLYASFVTFYKVSLSVPQSPTCRLNILGLILLALSSPLTFPTSLHLDIQLNISARYHKFVVSQLNSWAFSQYKSSSRAPHLHKRHHHPIICTSQKPGRPLGISFFSLISNSIWQKDNRVYLPSISGVHSFLSIPTNITLLVSVSQQAFLA